MFSGTEKKRCKKSIRRYQVNLTWVLRVRSQLATTTQIFYFTGCNEVVAKVLFLHLFVHSVHRGGLPQCMLGYHHPRADTPLGPDPPEQTPPKSRPPRSRHTPGSRLQHTVYERPVRILLECILVSV